ncbi:MAG: hypothetical protein FJ253_03830 [Phycisphaerae bacterium]|nr:hypothetical protein [Phycisphaerae bacterium]
MIQATRVVRSGSALPAILVVALGASAGAAPESPDASSGSETGGELVDTAFGSGVPDAKTCAQGACDCIGAEERQLVASALRAYELSFGSLSSADGLAGAEPLLYPFVPIAGNLDQDRFHSSFVDLLPGTGLFDFNCGGITYDGHLGIDTMIRSWWFQSAGVPVFAVLDGTVVYAHDGEPDQNTCVCGAGLPGTQCPPGTLGNAVIIDHGQGRLGYYWHLRNGSVSVSLGEVVKTGRQIGLVASSGCSTGPHLHFESQQSGAAFEPNAGLCRPGESGWVSQEPLQLDLKKLAFGVHRSSLSGIFPPQEFPTSRQIALSDPLIYIWVNMGNLPAASTWQFQFVRPNGSVSFTSNVGSFANPFFRWVWSWWSWNVNDMHTIAGTWTVRLFVNGAIAFEEPVEVVAAINPAFNRAPYAVTAALAPASPSVHDAIVCRISGHFPVVDPDFDLVTNRYRWRVNGVVVRDVTTGGRADMLPAGAALADQVVECEVTPSDGQLSATPALASATVQCRVESGDFNGDGHIDGDDLGSLLGEWGACPGCGADLNCDGEVDGDDLGSLLGNWTG